jgi:hypothetical protein
MSARFVPGKRAFGKNFTGNSRDGAEAFPGELGFFRQAAEPCCIFWKTETGRRAISKFLELFGIVDYQHRATVSLTAQPCEGQVACAFATPAPPVIDDSIHQLNLGWKNSDPPHRAP